MNEFLSQLELWLSTHQQWLAIAIFITAFIESLAIAGVIVPGVAIIFLLAVLTGHGGTTLSMALFMAFLGAVAGDGISFYLGRYFKQDIHKLWPFTRYPKMLSSGEAFFHKHGGKSIVIGRFIGPVRPIIPLVVGALNYSPKRFFSYNILSALGWAPAYILPGYMVGASLQSDMVLPPHFYPIVLSTIGIFSLLFIVITRLHWTLQSESRLYDFFESKMAEYSQTHRFWKILSSQRPDIRGEFPLPSLTALIISVLLFILLALIVTETHWLQGVDQQGMLFFSQLKSDLIDPVMITITLLGDSTFLYVPFITGVILLLFRGHTAAAVHIAIAGIATVILSHGLKDFFALARPDTLIMPLDTYAFPSGHTSGTTVFVMLLATFIAQEQAPKRRWKTYLSAITFVSIMGLSRLYLGVHWITDILGGILLGVAITAATRISFNRYDKEALTFDITTLLAALLVVAAAVIYVGFSYDSAITMYLTKTT